jgi:hypothetical protein
VIKLLLTAFLALPASANHLPGGGGGAAPQPVVPGGRIAEYENNARFAMKLGSFEPVADFSLRWKEETGAPFRWFSAGGYWRAHKNLKIGALYRVQSGARHNDDWVESPTGGWGWRDTSRRSEHLWIVDVSPRILLDFIPGGEDWMLSSKIQYQRNTYFREQTLRLIPEISWIWMDGLDPRATFALRNEFNFGLNFGEHSLYERWTYLIALWHPVPAAAIGPSIGLRDMTWSTSDDYKRSGLRYHVLHRAWTLGLDAAFRF